MLLNCFYLSNLYFTRYSALSVLAKRQSKQSVTELLWEQKNIVNNKIKISTDPPETTPSDIQTVLKNVLFLQKS